MAIFDKFRNYFDYASSFTVYIDNNTLTYVLTTAKLNATGYRWVAELADFKFNIRYRPGQSNGDADALARLPAEFVSYMADCTEEVPMSNIDATIDGIEALKDGNAIWISALTHDDDVMELDQQFLFYPYGFHQTSPKAGWDNR